MHEKPSQEILAFVASLNEQAVRDINQHDDGHDLEIGQQRLLKALKIVDDPKSHFEDNHRAIISYNLACSYQMQGELTNCS